MKITFLLLIISLLVIMGVLFLASRDKQDKINYKQVILNVALVLFGFSLAITWDNIREVRIERKERESLVIMLQAELGHIHGAITNNLQTIEANLEALNKGKEIVRPLVLFETTAWESAKLRSNIFIRNTGDLFKIVNLYSAIHIVNEKIRFRENYRMGNQAMSNYNERLKKIDNDLKQALEKIKGFHVIAQEFLHKEYPIVVKGYSFTLDKGLVKEVEKNK